MKKFIKPLIFFVITILFVAIPLPPADIYIRLHFWEAEGQYCELYYTTTDLPVYTQEQSVRSDIDYDTMQVTFRLDSSLKDRLNSIRLDFPNTDKLIGIENITVNSAGIVQKQYNPCHFFKDDNIVSVNQAEYSLVTARNRVYIAPLGEDPFFVFTSSVASQINNCFSQYRLSRLFLCLFVAGCYILAKKKLFKA